MRYHKNIVKYDINRSDNKFPVKTLKAIKHMANSGNQECWRNKTLLIYTKYIDKTIYRISSELNEEKSI